MNGVLEALRAAAAEKGYNKVYMQMVVPTFVFEKEGERPVTVSLPFTDAVAGDKYVAEVMKQVALKDTSKPLLLSTPPEKPASPEVMLSQAKARARKQGWPQRIIDELAEMAQNDSSYVNLFKNLQSHSLRSLFPFTAVDEIDVDDVIAKLGK
jgi:hypothetical protein